MSVNESATATDGFGIVSTPVEDLPTEPAPIQAAEPTKRRRSGRVDFPGGVYVVPHLQELSQFPINIAQYGWTTVGVARQLAASLAGAVAEVERQEAAEKAREEKVRP